MFALKALLALLGATALAAPAAVPGEVNPTSRVPKAGHTTWWCQWKHHVLFDTYTLETRNWGISEGQLKKQIASGGAAITGWGYEKTEDGMGFRAHVSFLPTPFVCLRRFFTILNCCLPFNPPCFCLSFSCYFARNGKVPRLATSNSVKVNTADVSMCRSGTSPSACSMVPKTSSRASSMPTKRMASSATRLDRVQAWAIRFPTVRPSRLSFIHSFKNRLAANMSVILECGLCKLRLSFRCWYCF